MSELESLVKLWPVIKLAVYVLLAYYVFSNAVQALPEPDEKSSKGYRYLFALLHGLAGNIRYAFSKVAPTFVKPQD